MFRNRIDEDYEHWCSTADSSNDDDNSLYSRDETPKCVNDVVCFSKESINSVVEVSEVPGKGRCLFSRKEFDPGSLIFTESPLFMILPTSDNVLWQKLNDLNDQTPFSLPPLWHKVALISIIKGNDESNEILKNKWVENPNQEITPDVYRILNSICTLVDGEYVYKDVVIKPEVYQLYLQVWPLNAFGRSSDPEGLIIYDKISYVAHSCDPSCCWHHTDGDKFVLRARKKLVPGDEITISYLGEADLLSPTFKRRALLQNWHFFCKCDRCSIPVDICRGFLCKSCHYGTVFLNYDSYGSKHTSTNCNMCWYKLNESETNQYIDLETAYISRIESIDRNDLIDILQVYDHAKNVFKQHWSLYQLQTLLYEYYKSQGNMEQAKFYLLDRINYVDKVFSGPLYCVAFMHEELADILSSICNIDQRNSSLGNQYCDLGTLNMIMSYYFNAAALLYILCGYKHRYYYSVITKRLHIEDLAISLIKKLSKLDSIDKK